jgi:glycosyltransferase involved in cell wall biosynthesis
VKAIEMSLGNHREQTGAAAPTAIEGLRQTDRAASPLAPRRRILEITSYPPPRSGWGVRVEFLKRRLEAEGHVCVVLNTGRSRRIPSPEYETVASGFDYMRKVWRFTRQGYIVHAHVNGNSPKGFALTLLAEGTSLLCGRRCYLTFHGGAEQDYFPRRNAPWLAPLYRVLFGMARRIICNNDEVKTRICEYGVPTDKVVPIPAFSTQYLESSQTRLPADAEAFFRTYSRVLLSYINIRPVFFPEVLVEGFASVAARHPDVGLLMCGVMGHQEKGLWPEVSRKIAQRRLEERILIVPDLPHDQFLTALTRSTMYVRTPPSDGVSSSVLEALALGVPVVAAANGHRPPGVVSYRADDPAALASAVERMLDAVRRRETSVPRPELRDTLREEIAVLTV